MFRNNPDMGHQWLLWVLLLAMGGCAKESHEAENIGAVPRTHGTVDDFGLPLVIRIESPEVPPEIAKPSSPPLKDNSGLD
jgi:hypothetical protein